MAIRALYEAVRTKFAKAIGIVPATDVGHDQYDDAQYKFLKLKLKEAANDPIVFRDGEYENGLKEQGLGPLFRKNGAPLKLITYSHPLRKVFNDILHYASQSDMEDAVHRYNADLSHPGTGGRPPLPKEVMANQVSDIIFGHRALLDALFQRSDSAVDEDETDYVEPGDGSNVNKASGSGTKGKPTTTPESPGSANP